MVSPTLPPRREAQQAEGADTPTQLQDLPTLSSEISDKVHQGAPRDRMSLGTHPSLPGTNLKTPKDWLWRSPGRKACSHPHGAHHGARTGGQGESRGFGNSQPQTRKPSHLKSSLMLQAVRSLDDVRHTGGKVVLGLNPHLALSSALHHLPTMAARGRRV